GRRHLGHLEGVGTCGGSGLRVEHGEIEIVDADLSGHELVEEGAKKRQEANLTTLMQIFLAFDAPKYRSNLKLLLPPRIRYPFRMYSISVQCWVRRARIKASKIQSIQKVGRKARVVSSEILYPERRVVRPIRCINVMDTAERTLASHYDTRASDLRDV